MPKNKVKFNLKNVHYALLTLTDNVPSYGTPVPMPDAVSLSLDANGEPENFYADGIEGKTNEESKDVQTEKLAIKATPLPNGTVKSKTGDTTDAETYAGWYSAVYLPSAEQASETETENNTETDPEPVTPTDLKRRATADGNG